MLKNKNSVYAPVLVLLLLVATFFVGRLSAQVESMKDGKVAAGTVDNGTAPAPQAVGAEAISVDSLKTMAKDLGVDSGKFNSCLDSGKMAESVASDLKEGQEFGVSGTPSFLINGILVVGAQPQSEFELVIDAELKNGGGDKVTLSSGPAPERLSNVPYGKGYVKGDKNAKIKIMEYTDFECPFCNRSFPTIEALLTKYGKDISLEYRSFPLSFHASAQKAAEAALCAGEQGKFWEMHDKMFMVMAGN